MPADDVTITATYVSTGPTIVLIVNWGDAAGNNVYEFSDWDDVFLGSYTSYTSSGPDGLVGSYTGTGVSGSVSGSSESFASGDTIVVTWYNTGGSQLTITPKISFTDPDWYNSGLSGTWYDMSQLVCPGSSSGTTEYTFDGDSAGSYSTVNVCRYTSGCAAMVMDKIEIER
jgi:hypothetical protein